MTSFKIITQMLRAVGVFFKPAHSGSHVAGKEDSAPHISSYGLMVSLTPGVSTMRS
jgi:hypothetical protein